MKDQCFFDVNDGLIPTISEHDGADLWRYMHDINRRYWTYRNQHPGSWEDSTCTRDFDVWGDCEVFREKVREFSASAGISLVGEALYKRMYSLIGFSRAYCCVKRNETLIYRLIEWDSLPRVFQDRLSREIRLIRDDVSAPLYESRKGAMMMQFETSWKGSIKYLRSHYKGPLTYPFSISEACVLIHMLPAPHSVVELYRGHPLACDEEFYVKCLLGCLTTFLKAQNLLPSDFGLCVDAALDHERVLIDCSIQFLCAFVDHCMIWK